MNELPDELVLQIAHKLEPRHLIQLQLVSRRFSRLAHDGELWKHICFENSRAEAARRRQELLSVQESSLAVLRQAMNDAFRSSSASESHSVASSMTAADRRRRAFANWDPSWPGEGPLDFYQEYIHRHAPLCLEWLQPPRDDASQPQETTGVGVLRGAGAAADRAIAPVDDGSICVWNIASHSSRASQGCIIARSNLRTLPVLSSHGNPATNETGAIENVAVDSVQKRAYFAVYDILSEVDLETLRVISSQRYPFPITSLSAANHEIPLTVGTAMTLHLHDTRIGAQGLSPRDNAGGESTCPVPRSHVTLSQPGPLSILHVPNSQEIWVGGRFTSLLNYDRRFWPRIKGTVFSGARLSSLSYLPNSYIPRELNLVRDEALALGDLTIAKSMPGSTLIGAGEYRGKGSLEFYGVSAREEAGRLPPHLSSMWSRDSSYRNRQTVSKSRLLSVSPHGARIVFSDGDGNLKWVERDGSAVVREFNINSGKAEAGRSTLFSRQQGDERGDDDIVQKIISTNGSSSDQTNKDDLLLWTGDGRLGTVGFGTQRTMGLDGNSDQDASVEDRAAAHEERMYGRAMRKALERQADETRFMRGLGFGMSP